MVKNHARKKDARARQAVTGETYPEASRNSAPSAVELLKNTRWLPVIHLGNGVYFDMNAEKPNLNITGAFGSGKTWLVNQIVDELIASKTKCEVIIIAGKEEQHVSAQKAQAEGSQTPKVALLTASRKDDPTYEELLLEEIAAKVKDEHYVEYKDSPLILIVDGINEVSEESTILLQTIAKHGLKRGIHTIITSNDGYGNLPVAIRRNGHSVKLGWVGYGRYGEEFGRSQRFCIGAPVEADRTIMVGSHVLTDDVLRNLVIVSSDRSPEAMRSSLAMDLAHQVLRKGWGVTVLSHSANEVNWKMVFGESIHLATKNAAVIIDDLASERVAMDERTRKYYQEDLGKAQATDPNRHLLIVDGYFDEGPFDAEYKYDEAAFLNFLRGSSSSAHIPVVMTSAESPWYYSQFTKAVVVPHKETNGAISEKLTSMGVMDMGHREIGDYEAVLTNLVPSAKPDTFSFSMIPKAGKRNKDS